MRFVVTGADTEGALRAFESFNPPTDIVEPVHVHPRQGSGATMLGGG
jgi:hypothetical protein